jgi:hypothetical protein
MTFTAAVLNTTRETRTTNGMKAIESSLSKSVDLFYKIGASRGKNLTAEFERAYAEDREIALRLAQWARDVRGGAGERQIYRDILLHLERLHKEELLETRILQNTAELGRWDDLLIFTDPAVKEIAYGLIARALSEKNGLAAKWMPRKGPIAADLRSFLNVTPKGYRKLLVGLTKVVETQMCAKDWNEINFSHVPSLAMSRYLKAFSKNSTSFVEFKTKLKSGDKSVKVNAAAVYPHQVIQSLRSGQHEVSDAQWNALPNYIGDSSVIPMVDVSGSMSCPTGGWNSKSTVQCIDVALALGLYCADKNTGPFKDLFLTFSANARFQHLKGSLSSKMAQMQRSEWGMNTNLHAGFEEILAVAVKNKVPAADMPGVLLILSDMQFDACVSFDDSAMQMIERKYASAGYAVPKIVFWNLHDAGNTPVRFDKKGTALVSGFSPAIMTAVLASDLEQFTPQSVMLKALSSDRYAL